MKRKHFIKKKEDFICEACRELVFGTGYTNHCPKCLWSKHVDKEIPGDRRSKCKGLMEPVSVGVKTDKYTIIHRCKKCGKETRNKSQEKDNTQTLIELSTRF